MLQFLNLQVFVLILLSTHAFSVESVNQPENFSMHESLVLDKTREMINEKFDSLLHDLKIAQLEILKLESDVRRIENLYIETKSNSKNIKENIFSFNTETLNHVRADNDSTQNYIIAITSILGILLGIIFPFYLTNRGEKQLNSLNLAHRDEIQSREQRWKETMQQKTSEFQILADSYSANIKSLAEKVTTLEENAKKSASQAHTSAIYAQDVLTCVEYAKLFKNALNEKNPIKVFELESQIQEKINSDKSANKNLYESKLKRQYSDYFKDKAIKLSLDKRFEPSLKMYEKSLYIDCNNANAYYNRGVTKRMMGDDESALADYSKAIEILPNFAYAYHNRASINLFKDNYKEALNDNEKAIELNPAYPLFIHQRAQIKAADKDYKNALTDFDRAIELDKNVYFFFYGRAECRFNINDFEGALSDINHAIEQESEINFFYELRSKIYEQLRNATESEKEKERLTDKMQSDRDTFNKLKSFDSDKIVIHRHEM